MEQVAFSAYYPKISLHDEPILTFSGEHLLAGHKYKMQPMYCVDKKCDCRRAMINIVESALEPHPFSLATISFGWESFDFYKRWGGGVEDDHIREFKGPALAGLQFQSKQANDLLGIFEGLVADPALVDCFKRQYVLFKYKLGMKLPAELLKFLDVYGPCPCGSGDSFKFCCGKPKSSFGRFRS